MTYAINRKCTSSKACVELCPTKSIIMGEGQYVIDADTCVDCGICMSVCPEHAVYKIASAPDADPAAKKPTAPKSK